MYEVVGVVVGVWRGWCVGGLAPVEDGGFEGEVGDEGGEIGGGAVGELRGKIDIYAGFHGGAFEGVAGGDDDWVEHEGMRNRAEEFFWGCLSLGFGFGLEEDFLPFQLWSSWGGGYWFCFFRWFFG